VSYKTWDISFPCSIEGLGADRVMAEAAEMGHSEFILCSIIYRGYRLVMPRHPRQIYQLETGLTFYPADESLYAGGLIRPASTRDWAGRDMFQEAAENTRVYRADLKAGVEGNSGIHHALTSPIRRITFSGSV